MSEAGGNGSPTPRASPESLRSHVEALESIGPRHRDVPGSREDALEHVMDQLDRAIPSLGASPAEIPGSVLEPFAFEGETHHNAVLRIPGSDPEAPRVLIGAHVDTVRGSPGADDNASGVAGVLECARLLGEWFDESGVANGAGPRATIELVVFDLEEQQLYTYRVGSRRHARKARSEGVGYSGALVFEMIGYTSEEPGSQRIPLPIRWMDIPDTGDFIAVAGDGKSGDLVRGFEAAAGDVAPGLDVVGVKVPLRGWAVWQSRLSDNASFWSEGYPALMITDTAFLRNPNYHTAKDRSNTLDYEFMARVVDATVELAKRLSG